MERRVKLQAVLAAVVSCYSLQLFAQTQPAATGPAQGEKAVPVFVDGQ